MDRGGLIILGICIIIAAIITRIPDVGQRYQMVVTGDDNVFILDTWSGHIWSELVPYGADFSPNEK